MKIFTEVQNYICRFTSITPEKDITIIDGIKGIEIYSIGKDDALYLTFEDTGNNAKFSRKKIFEKVSKFVAVRIAKTSMIAIAVASGKKVYLAITLNPQDLFKDDFKVISFNGISSAESLIPSSLLISALEKGITLFLEMKNASGRIEQFACALESDHPSAIKYFPLASNYSFVNCSAVGRAVNQYVDGIYTCGEYGDTKQLLYTPSYNIFGDSQPAVIRLKTNFNVETICSYPLSQNIGTNLFAVGEGNLYFYPYDSQADMYHSDNPDPKLCVSSELFKEAKKVMSVVFGEKIYVYVLNESNILSYTFADYLEDIALTFCFPVRLYEGAYYFDISSEGIMNICTSKAAVFGKRDSVTGQWNFSEAYIETTLDEFKTINSYVTKIATNTYDADVIIKAKGKDKVSCYVNKIYHNFLSLNVKSDALGYITITQEATDFNPPCLEIFTNNESVLLNPAFEARKKLLTLTNDEKAKAEIITYPNSDKEKLFKDVQDSDIKVITSSIIAFGSVTNSFNSPYFSGVEKFKNGIIVKIVDKVASVLPYEMTHNPFITFLSDVVKDIGYVFNWIGDKLKWLYDKTIKPVVEFVVAKIQDVWKFAVKIGEKVLEVVIDTLEIAFGTLKKILELIGIPVDKIFDWLKKALHLNDVERNNNVMKKIVKLSSDNLIKQSLEMKNTVIEKLNMAIDSIALWGDIDTSKAKKSITEGFNTKARAKNLDITPHNSYMFDTIYGGLSFSEIILPKFEVSQKLGEALSALEVILKKEMVGVNQIVEAASTITESIEEIFGAEDIFQVCDYLKKILGTVAIIGLELTKSIIKTIFEIVIIALEGIVKVLENPMHIPFVSQVLKFFGIKKFSFIDLFTFPTAFLMTNVVMGIREEVMFNEDIYDAIMDASSLDSLGSALTILV